MASREQAPAKQRSRDAQVRRVIVIEGSANIAVLLLKLAVALTTGSLAILGDAIHSLTDVANNAVAWLVVRLSGQPPDREHPYGHRKFETLAVFALATLLTVLAFELGLQAFRSELRPVATESWALGLMAVVLLVNIALATWESGRARQLASDILRADARHTFADVLTTLVVIAGWQLAAHGHPWLDRLCAVGVAGLILFLAYGLFRRAVPVLVDHVAVDPEAVRRVARSVPGVESVANVRSRSIGSEVAIDMVIRVRARLPTGDSHALADAVEKQVRSQLAVSDVTVHVEPDERPISRTGRT